jgi:hypothetical protein
MTKFEELCQASNKAVVDLHRLKQECYEHPFQGGLASL